MSQIYLKAQPGQVVWRVVEDEGSWKIRPVKIGLIKLPTRILKTIFYSFRELGVEGYSKNQEWMTGEKFCLTKSEAEQDRQVLAGEPTDSSTSANF